MKRNPWRLYAANTTVSASPSRGWVNVPVRHKRNLYQEGCAAETQQAAIDYYTNGKFETWEVNARNLMVEITGALDSVDPSDSTWALADAIGIAYAPYNRAAENRKFLKAHPAWTVSNLPWKGIGTDGYSGLNPLGVLLRSNQFGVMTERNGAETWRAGLRGVGGVMNYEMSLVVAYGVHFQLFRDTSYGAVSFRHRGPGNAFINGEDPSKSYVCGVELNGQYAVDKGSQLPRDERFTVVGGGPTFFLPVAYRIDGTPKEDASTDATSQELQSNGGWPKPSITNWRAPLRPGCGYFTP